jgi:hypothetical protein
MILSSCFSEQDGEITWSDVVMFLLAPFTAIPIFAVFILSRVVDLDKPIFKKNSSRF